MTGIDIFQGETLNKKFIYSHETPLDPCYRSKMMTTWISLNTLLPSEWSSLRIITKKTQFWTLQSIIKQNTSSTVQLVYCIGKKVYFRLIYSANLKLGWLQVFVFSHHLTGEESDSDSDEDLEGGVRHDLMMADEKVWFKMGIGLEP